MGLGGNNRLMPRGMRRLFAKCRCLGGLVFDWRKNRWWRRHRWAVLHELAILGFAANPGSRWVQIILLPNPRCRYWWRGSREICPRAWKMSPITFPPLVPSARHDRISTGGTPHGTLRTHRRVRISVTSSIHARKYPETHNSNKRSLPFLIHRWAGLNPSRLRVMFSTVR